MAGAPEKAAREECDVIVAALKKADDVPVGVVEMLCRLVPLCLPVYSLERHAYQVNVVDMVGTVLGGVKAKLEASADEAAAKVAGRDQEEAKRRAAVLEHANIVAAKKGAAALKEAAFVKEQTSFSFADEVLKKGLKAQKDVDKAYDALAAQKAALESVAMGTFSPMRTAAGTKEQIQFVVKAFRKYGLDDTLVETLPVVVQKDPAFRSDFDKFVIGRVEAGLAKKAAEFETRLSSLLPEKAARGATVTSAQSAFNAAKEALGSANASFAEAESEVAVAEFALDAAEKALKGFDAEMKAAEAAEGATKQELTDFLEGPFADFHDRAAAARRG